MAKALYRTYRPKSLAEVSGQDHVTETLKNAIKSGRVSHAYLFTGPRGVGKTSVARILAHEVNDLKYDDDTVHLDIIEIDAASNRRIDEIRDLREKVHITPTSARYKVYIIDEVHMLTKEAFNALLKTLEEPPAHCIFILATTEAHKLPETIISRTQRFNFKPIAPAAAAAHLGSIAKDEKIAITPEALELLAEHGNGSFRDSISLLDQLSGLDRTIDAGVVRQSLGLPAQTAVSELLKFVETGDSQSLLALLGDLREKAINPAGLAKALSKQLRQKAATHPVDEGYISLLKSLLDIPASPQPEDSLEIAVEAASQTAPAAEPNIASSQPTKQAEKPTETLEITDKPRLVKTDLVLGGSQDGFSLNDWPAIIDTVKKEAASLYTALRLAVPSLENDTLTLAFQFPLHQKKIAAAGPKELIGRLIEESTGTKLAVRSIVDKSMQSSKMSPVKPEVALPIDTSIQSISNIFGGGEVLES